MLRAKSEQSRCDGKRFAKDIALLVNDIQGTVTAFKTKLPT